MDYFNIKIKDRPLFKLVLGLGNLNFAQIEHLVEIYSELDVDIFDIAPSKEAIECVFETLEKNNKKRENFLFCLSFALFSDKHNKIALLNKKKCKKCMKCVKKCPQKAISFNVFPEIDKKKCIGCQKCSCSAIDFHDEKTISAKHAAKLAIENKIQIVEMHCSVSKTKEIKQQFIELNKHFEGPISVCFSREKLSEEKLIKLVEFFIEIRNGKQLIIQADGFGMTGEYNSFKSTLNAVSNAQIFQRFYKFDNFNLFISGGTNEKTAILAKMCDIKFSGITVGSCARKIVENKNKEQAFKIAKKLIQSVKN